METDKSILKILIKDIAIKPTITSLAKELDLSRVGLWKVLKRMQSEKLIVLTTMGTGKTSTYLVSLNWGNPILEKVLSLALTQDAINNQRWLNNFSELESKLDFLILYGSILYSPKEANDIDIVAVVSDRKQFKHIEEIIAKMQKSQIKKIHALSFTQEEFAQEIRKPNKVFIDALKKGIILFGQEEFIMFMRDLRKT